MVVAVAEESRGADHARQWIDAAKSEYWQLIDRDHRLEDLYNLVNVPQAIWIDEQGRIVRPPETAGSTDHFRRMDLKTRTMSPKDQEERLAARQAYLQAVRDWVDTGKHSLPPAEARAGLPRVTPEIAEARARFVAEYKDKFANPYAAAALGYIDGVIRPRETRHRIATSLRMLRNKRQGVPTKKHGNPPM